MSNNLILSIHKSRVHIVEHLENLGYNVDDHKGFGINEVDAMFASNQLDMLVSNPTTNNKAYVHYSVSKKPNVANLVREMFHDNADSNFSMNKNDTLIVIQEDEPNESLVSYLTTLYNRDGIFVVVHALKRLQFNILKHMLVPKYRPLTETEKAEIMKKFAISKNSQFPEIGRFDPVALALCVRPGDVCEITTPSPTAAQMVKYRVCV
jgi:DNA-directed RNA polymerase subunit H